MGKCYIHKKISIKVTIVEIGGVVKEKVDKVHNLIPASKVEATEGILAEGGASISRHQPTNEVLVYFERSVHSLPRFSLKNPDNICEACQLGKQHGHTLPSKRNVSKDLLDVIYSEVWACWTSSHFLKFKNCVKNYTNHKIQCFTIQW